MKTVEKVCKLCSKPFQAPLWRETSKGRLGPQKFCGKVCASKGARARPLEERFWEKVDKRGPFECWPWVGAVKKHYQDFYGRIWAKRPDGVLDTRFAHRVSWELANGPVPEGLIVRHRCDNPRCVNPAHLETGTLSDNSQDCLKRGRRKTWKKMRAAQSSAAEQGSKDAK